MTTNPYVNLHDNSSEQDLAESLITESIQMFGYDVFYIVRQGDENNNVFQEEEQTEFTAAFPIEMYIKSVDGYGGDGQFLSNFGIEVRHQAMFTVAQNRWKSVAANIDTPEQITLRPREGDLIYFRKDHKLLEIKRVNKYEMFYQLGALYTWDLTCELFQYSSEKFSTGVEEIDRIETTNSLSTRDKGSIVDGIPEFDPGFDMDNPDTEEFVDNDQFETESTPLIDFSEDNPFSEDF